MRAPATAIRFRKALTTSVFDAIGVGPVMAFAQAAAPQSAFLRLVTDDGFQSAPLRTPLIRATGDATASLVGEGAAIPVTDISFDGERLTPQKAAAIVIATNEAWADISGAGQRYINDLLRRGVGKVVDARMFEVLEASPALEFTASRTDSTAIATAFQSMLVALLTEAGQRFRFILSPEAAALLSRLAPATAFRLAPMVGISSVFRLVCPATCLPGNWSWCALRMLRRA